jgi:hypothetical protein
MRWGGGRPAEAAAGYNNSSEMLKFWAYGARTPRAAGRSKYSTFSIKARDIKWKHCLLVQLC